MSTDLPETYVARLRAIVEAVGEREAIRVLGIPRSTLARVLARLRVHAGTALYVRTALDGYEPPTRARGVAARA